MTNAKYWYNIKQELYRNACKVIAEQVRMLEQNLESIRNSRDSETKSSVGDKYETGRAMLQIEEDNYRRQLDQALRSKTHLEKLHFDKVHNRVEQGSLVVCDQSSYFISIALGEMLVDNKMFYCISAASPIGQNMMDKKPGHEFELNGKSIKIHEVH